MSALLGGDPDTTVAHLEKLGLTPANVNGAGQIVAAGTLEQLAALEADKPEGVRRVVALKVAGAFHTVHMAPAVEAQGRGAAAGAARNRHRAGHQGDRLPAVAPRQGRRPAFDQAALLLRDRQAAAGGRSRHARRAGGCGYLDGSFPPEVIAQMQKAVPLRLLLEMWPIFLAAREQNLAQVMRTTSRRWTTRSTPSGAGGRGPRHRRTGRPADSPGGGGP